ncbi:MAG TPA: serine/threonine-protein kinase [Gemmatimonas sp.]|uniref:serine/threonine-protein kinase n=1 Tax=Gemmatimonas sp. TaxID=1962908 RepID=UPI002EDB64AA
MAHDAIADLRAALGDRFAIERLLGRGGMGAVYLARDRQLDRPVALKVLPAEFATQHDLRERFLRETRTTAGFSHPNIVPVFSIEEHASLLAYAMGYVEGESLAELVARNGPLAVRDVVRVMQDIGYALAYAHGRGVVHRDIKPDNIMIERATGRAMLMDFGISRAVSAAPVPGTRANLTRVGEVVGTPEYMSPEQASGDHIDGRSDLYSLGLVAWFALTGRPAVAGESTQKVLVKQLTESVPPIATMRSDVPPQLAVVVDRCVLKAPEARFENAAALVEALDVASLRGVEIPLPVRLLAQGFHQASVVVLFELLMLPLMYYFLSKQGLGDLDTILPIVMLLAITWGRLAQVTQQLRSVVIRGFSVETIQTGFKALRAERDAERAQLRANPMFVAKRRRQVIILVSAFVASFVLQQWVIRTMRTELSPGWYGVSTPGVIILFAAYVMRGVAVVGLIRSPLRASVGERFYDRIWAGWPGRLVMHLLSRGVRPQTATFSDAFPQTMAPPASTPVSLLTPRAPRTPVSGDATVSLEQRVASLEAWRKDWEQRGEHR